MLLTLADRFDRAFLPYVSRDLFSTSDENWFRGLLSCLPNIMSPALGIECPISPGLQAGCDFATFLPLGEPARLLAGQHPARELPAALSSQPVWKRLSAFASAWVDPNRTLGACIPNLWLEFDQSSKAPHETAPKFFLKLACAETADREKENSAAVDVFAESAGLLTGAEPSPQLVSRLRGLVREACEGVQFFQIGARLCEGAAPARVCLRGAGHSWIGSFLETITDRSSSRKILEFLTSIEGCTDRVDLALDVSDSILPRIGLECHVPNAFSDSSQWDQFLDLLVELGYCADFKRAALKAYSGFTTDLLEKNAWSSPHSQRYLVLGYHRWIHHIKIDFYGDGRTCAKAYLGVNQRGVYAEAVKPLVEAQIAARGVVLGADAKVPSFSSVFATSRNKS